MAEEAPDVSAVFKQQRIRFVFWVALEEDELALSPLFDEGVDARIGRPREHAIAARRQDVLRNIVPPGMGHRQLGWGVDRQSVI